MLDNKQKTKSVNKYKAKLKINKNNIEMEILEQAQLYYEWAYLASEAEIERDEIKETLEVIMTSVENTLRANCQQFFGKDNPTEPAIKAKVNSDVAVRKQKRSLFEANAKYKLLRKAELAFEQRKSMIEAYLKYMDKVKFSEVRVPREELKTTSQKLKQRLNRGK